jgi:Hemerythrin HHE cation binding domain
VPDLDLIDFLLADHQILLDADPAPRVVDVSQHLSVERDLLYPVITDHAVDGAAVVEDLRHAERQLEERLRDFERAATDEHRERLRGAIVDHVDSQEQLFARLRGEIPETALLASTDSIALSVGGSPTHAHPHLAEGGLIGHLVEDVTSAVDHTLDRLHEGNDSERG